MSKRGQANTSQYKETVAQNLANNAVGAGVAHPATQFTNVQGLVFADQAGTLAVEQSYDGSTNWRQSKTTAVVASTPVSVSDKVVRPFVRVTFKNTSGGAACTVVELDCALFTSS